MESQRDSNLRLPLTWASRQQEKFKAYLSKNAHIDFTYQGTDFHVDVQEVLVFYQGVAAIARKINQFKGTNMLADIGNGTMNVLNVNERKIIPKSCFTEKYGTKARFSNFQFEKPRFRLWRNWV